MKFDDRNMSKGITIIMHRERMKFDDRNMSKGITIIMHRESAHSKNLCQGTNNDIEYEAPRMSMRSMKTYYKMIGGKEHNTVCEHYSFSFTVALHIVYISSNEKIANSHQIHPFYLFEVLMTLAHH